MENQNEMETRVVFGMRLDILGYAEGARKKYIGVV